MFSACLSYLSSPLEDPPFSVGPAGGRLLEQVSIPVGNWRVREGIGEKKLELGGEQWKITGCIYSMWGWGILWRALQSLETHRS